MLSKKYYHDIAHILLPTEILQSSKSWQNHKASNVVPGV
jgi:hypothetical protein